MSKLKKFIAVLVSLCLCISILPKLSYSAIDNINAEVTNIGSDIFKGFKSIGSSYKEDSHLLIIVNDLHSNPYVQKSIYTFLNKLNTLNSLSNVFVEGAPYGKVNLLKTAIDANEENERKIIDIMMSSGLISGAEVFGINNNFDQMYGIEQWDKYLESLKIASEKYNKSDEDNFLESIKQSIYFNSNQETKDIIDRILQVSDMDNSSNANLLKIYRDNQDFSVQLKNYDEINKYLKISYLENKLENQNIEKEISQFEEFLKNNLSYKEYLNIIGHFSKGNTYEFFAEFYDFLKKRFLNVFFVNNVLSEFLYVQELKYSLDFNKLLSQIELFKINLINTVNSPYDKESIEMYFYADILNKYAKLDISEQEFNYIQKNKDEILKTSYRLLDKQQYLRFSKILLDDDIIHYYQNNLVRNEIFYRNILNILTKYEHDEKVLFKGKEYKSINIAVIGGFHGDVAKLIGKDISYINLMPAADNTDKQTYRNTIELASSALSSALAPPLLSAVNGNKMNMLIEYWSGFDNIYSRKTVKSVNEWILKHELPLKIKKGRKNRIIVKYISEEEKTNIFKRFSKFLKSIPSKISGKSAPKMIYQDKTRESVVLDEYLKTIDSLNGQMPDLILICVKNEEEIKFYQNVVKKMKKNMPLEKVNFKFIHASDNGTGASFIAIGEYIESLKKRIRFKSIKDKKWSDLKIAAINIDGIERTEVMKELPFHFNGQNITSFELSVLNGIRACQSFGDKGGLALMNPESAYIGSMKPKGDITIISSMKSYDDIIEDESPWIISKESLWHRTPQKIYYDFNVEKISSKLEKEGILGKTYNIENKKVKQFETTTGNMLFSFENEDDYAGFWSQISALYKHIYKNEAIEQKAPEINFIKHILIPLVRMKNKEDALSYFAKMGIDKELGEFYDKYSSFFDSHFNKSLDEIIKEISIETYKQPHSLYMEGLKSFDESSYFNDPVQIAEDVHALPYVRNDAVDNDLTISLKEEYSEIFQQVLDTRLQKIRYDNDRADMSKLYKEIVRKTSQNRSRINQYLDENDDISPALKQELENMQKLYIALEYYSLEYLNTIDSFENISILGGYIFPKSSIFEKLKIMPFNRRIFGMHANFMKEKKKLQKQAYKLYILGNNISSSMYDYDTLLNGVKEYIDKKENPSEKTYLGIEKRWTDRKAIQRILSIFMAAQSVISSLIVAISTVNGNLALLAQSNVLGTIAFSFFSGLGISIALHRVMIFLGKRNTFYRKNLKKLSRENKDYFNNLNYMSDEDKLLDVIMAKLKTTMNKNKDLKKEIKEIILQIRRYKKTKNKEIFFNINKGLTQLSDKLPETSLKHDLDILDSFLPVKETYPAIASHHALAKRNIIESSQEYLSKWKSVLNSGDMDINRLEIIRKYALQIIKTTVFSEDSFDAENKERIITIIQDFMVLYNATMDKITTMSDSEKEKVKLEIRSFEETGEYAESYYKMLSYALNADILNGYRISEGAPLYFLETLKIMPFIRSLLGINFGIYASQKGFFNSLSKLMKSGNFLIPGLYDENKIMDFSKKYFDSKRNPKTQYIGINEFWKIRKMLARTFPLLFFVRKVIISGVYTDPIQFLAAFVASLGILFSMHWVPIVYGLLHTRFHKNIVKNKLRKGQNVELLQPLRSDIIENKVLEISQSASGAVPDIVFVSINSDNEGINDIKRLMERIMQNGNLKNTKIEFVLNRNHGDGNALMDVLYYMSSEEYALKYPELAEKGINETEAVVLNIDGLNYEDIIDPINFKINGESTSPLEISLLNAINLIQNADKKGNIIIADPSYLYFGSLKHTGDITLLSADSDYEQIRSQNLPVFIAGKVGEERPGQSLLKKIYKSLDLDAVHNIILKDTLENILKQKGEHSDQVSTFSGLLAISMDENDMQEFSKYIVALKNFIENYEGEKFKVDFMNHIMIPYTMLNNGEDIDVYLAKMMSAIDNPETRTAYNNFFSKMFEIHKEFYEKDKHSLKVNIVMPPESMLSKAVIGDGYYSTLKYFMESIYENKVLPDEKKETLPSEVANKAIEMAKPLMLSSGLTNKISTKVSEKKKTLLFMMDDLSPDNIGHLISAEQAGINAITMVLEDDDEGFDEDFIAIDVPIEDSVISAKVMIKESAENSYILKFMPLYSGTLSEKENEIIKSILSSEYENGIDAVRKKIFFARASLSFIKESSYGRKDLGKAGDILREALSDDLLSIISIDGAGVFAHPQIIEDEFFNDQVLNEINFGAVYMNQEISNDKIMISPEEKDSFGFSYEAGQHNVFNREFIDTGLISALYANAAFTVNLGESITEDINIEDYKLRRIDKSLFYNDPVRYISDLSGAIDLLSFKYEDYMEADAHINTLQRIIPSLTIDTISDISSLEKSLDPQIVNSVIISNLYAETERGSVIGNILNPMLADLKVEMDRIGYKDDSFLRLILNEKADTKIWNAIPSRFYAAGILLSHIKTKPRELKLFEDFKKEKFMIDSEKDFEYFTASVLSGKSVLTESEINEIKSLDPKKWDAACEQLKYMEYIVFNQLKRASQKLRSQGIKLIIKTNLMTLAGSTEIKDDYFESYNDGETILFPQYNINPERFPLEEKLNFLKNNFSIDGFLISNIDSYKGKEKVSQYLQKKFQSGLDRKMVLIFEDDDASQYPNKENVFILTSNNVENIIYKAAIEESSTSEEILDAIKECEFEHINFPLSFSKDAGIKLESIKQEKKNIHKVIHSNTTDYYIKGLKDSLKNKRVRDEAEQLIMSEEEESVYKVSAKGVLIFNALYSYIKTNKTDGDLLLSYLSDSGALYSIAGKYLTGLDKNSPIIR